MSEKFYPCYIYIYDSDGFHSGSIRANNTKELGKMFANEISNAINERREVRITDTGDLMLFHSYNGCIKYDGMKHHECENCRGQKSS